MPLYNIMPPQCLQPSRLRFIACALCIVAYTLPAHAATRTYDADSNATWDTPANWSGNTLPLSADDAVFDASVGTVSAGERDVDILGDQDVNSITFNNSGSGGDAFSFNTFTSAVINVHGSAGIVNNDADAQVFDSASINFQGAGNFDVNAAAGDITFNTAFTGSSSATTNIDIEGSNQVNLTGGGSNFNNINLNGSGTTVIGGSLTPTGNINISSGTLELGANNVLANTADIVMTGGTFSTGGFAETLDSLTLNGNVVIDAAATSGLNFSSTVYTSGSIDIYNWVYDNDPIDFGTMTGFGGNESNVAFYSGAGTGFIGNPTISGGMLTAVPEPSTYAAAALLAAAAGYRRFKQKRAHKA